MSKILIHSIAFSPDGVSTAYLYNDIALKFKDSGYEVIVLTTSPHYNVIDSEVLKQPLSKKMFGLYLVSFFNGIKVYHIPQKKYKSSVLRMLGFVYWHIMSLLIGLFQKNVSVILSPSPPLTIGLINLALGKLKCAKVIYNVQEIYPDLLIEEGGLKSKIIISFLKKIEKIVYNFSDAVTTIDKIFYNTIVDRFIDKSKLSIIPNFVDTEIYKPLVIGNEIDKNLFPETDSLKIMYAGNIGHAQDWDTLIETARQLKHYKIDFFVIGEGVMKSELEKAISSYSLNNIHLIPYQSRDIIPMLIAYSDLQFIFMSPHTEGHGFPSKVYTIMACAKPLLVCSGSDTPIVNFLNEKKCSFIISEKEKNKKVSSLVDILKMAERNLLKEMGENGFKHIAENYSKEIVTEKYFKLVEYLIQ